MPNVFLDNNAARLFIMPGQDKYRNAIETLVNGLPNVKVVRTPLSLLEFLGLSRNNGFPPPATASLFTADCRNEDDRTFGGRIAAALSDARLHYESIPVDESCLRRAVAAQAKYVDEKSNSAQSLFEAYVGKMMSVPVWASFFVDALAASHLHKCLSGRTDLRAGLCLLSSSLEENYGQNPLPIILSPYRAALFLAKRLLPSGNAGLTQKDLDKGSLKAKGDELDAELISVALLGFPVEQRTGALEPVVAITGDRRIDKILFRAKVMYHVLEFLLNGGASTANGALAATSTFLKKFRFAPGSITAVDDAGNTVRVLTAADWSQPL